MGTDVIEGWVDWLSCLGTWFLCFSLLVRSTAMYAIYATQHNVFVMWTISVVRAFFLSWSLYMLQWITFSRYMFKKAPQRYATLSCLLVSLRVVRGRHSENQHRKCESTYCETGLGNTWVWSGENSINMLRLDLLSNTLMAFGKGEHGNVHFKNVEEQLQKTGREFPAAEGRQKATGEMGRNYPHPQHR